VRNYKPVIAGVSGATGLLIIYFTTLTWINSFNHAVKQFSEIWYWIIILIFGFGIQLGLYSYIRASLRQKLTGTTAEVATAGGVSTGSMILCCAHHITDALPIIGLSAAAVFLAKYQLAFILLGIFSNLVGIIVMLNIIQDHELFPQKNFFKGIFSYDMKKVRNLTVAFSLVIVSLPFLVPLKTANPTLTTSEARVINLPAKINEKSSASIEIKPVDFSFSQSLKFEISINTHQGSLDFDLTKISFLEDDKGNIYRPLSWDGSPPGGHHRFGTLTFPKLKERTKFIKLTIKDVYNVPERVFEWELP
jgi:hypothetical protein